MASEANAIPDDLEQLRRRFEEFRAKPVTNCSVEVESTQGGKLRLELKSIATTELVHLIRAFVRQ